MFFKDDNGIQVCQMGDGDVIVSEIKLTKASPKECVGICFGKTELGEINRILHEYKDKKDYEAGIKVKLLFTDVKSIDVVISKLNEAKESMNGMEGND